MNVLLNSFRFTQNVCHDFAECWTLALSKQDFDQKMYALLDGNKCWDLWRETDAVFGQDLVLEFLVKILYWQCKNPALYNVSSSTSQRLSVNLRSELVCESDSSSSASFQPFFHNLGLMNLDIVILEYGHDDSKIPSVKKMYT